MPAIHKVRRVLLTLLACFMFASVSITPALGASAQTAKKRHHKSHHKKHSTKKNCSRDGDGDGVEPSGNDHDGCGV